MQWHGRHENMFCIFSSVPGLPNTSGVGLSSSAYRPFNVIIEFDKLKICELHCHALAFNTRSLGNSGKGSFKKQSLESKLEMDCRYRT